MTRFADFFSTTLCQIGVPLLCKVLRKMTLKNGEIWKINFRFCQNFTPHYLKTSYGEGTPCSYRVVGKKSETLGMCIGVRFGFVLGEFCPFKENEYRSEHLVGIFGNFWEFLSLHWGTILFNSIQNTEIRVPGAQIHYFTTLMCFCKKSKILSCDPQNFLIKISNLAIFQTHFSPNFLQWPTSNLYYTCREKISESSHIYGRLVWLCFEAVLPLWKKWIPIWNTGRYFLGIFLAKFSPKSQNFDQNLKISFKFLILGLKWFFLIWNFWPSFSQNFTWWRYLSLLQGCREKIRDSPHIFWSSVRLRFDRVFAFWKKWIPIWSTGQYFQEFFFEIFWTS